MTVENVEQQSLLRKNIPLLEEFKDATHKYPSNVEKIKDWMGTLPVFEQSFFHGEQEDKEDSEEEKETGKENEIEEEIVSDSDGEELLEEELIKDPYWSQSNRPKNFSRQMEEFEASQTETRKRKRTSQGQTPNKRARKEALTLLKKAPTIGMTVWVHFSADCDCNKSTLACTCNVWYSGQVLEETQITEAENKKFIVKFYEDDTVETIKWEKDCVWWGKKQ